MYQRSEVGPLVAPALIVAFNGWVSAGGAGIATAEHIAGSGPVVARFDSDLLYDYRVNRPTLEFTEGIIDKIEWPETRVRRRNIDGRDLLVLAGPEPNWHWQAFGEAVADVESRAVFTQQIDQRNQELREKRGRLTQINTSLEFLDKELSMSRPLVKQGAMSEVELLRLERQANDLKGELDSTRISIPRLESAVSEARQKLESYVAKFRADAQGDLNQVRAEQEGTAATSVALKDRVERAVVRSPVNGTVKSVKVTTIGGVVQPGSELMEIVPLEDNLLVEARVRPRDIAFLRPGQDALVKITAYDFSIYGGFPAKLEHISADSITDEKKGESYYLVQVRTTSNVPAARHEPLAIIPGMTATVHIQTGEKTFLHYLLKPIIKTREMAFRER